MANHQIARIQRKKRNIEKWHDDGKRNQEIMSKNIRSWIFVFFNLSLCCKHCCVAWNNRGAMRMCQDTDVAPSISRRQALWGMAISSVAALPSKVRADDANPSWREISNAAFARAMASSGAEVRLSSENFMSSSF